MKNRSAGKWLGIAACAVGVPVLVFFAIVPTVGFLAGRSDGITYVLSMALYSILTIPAVVGVYYGARLVETPTKYRIRRASAFLCVAFAVAVDFAGSSLTSRLVLDESYETLVFSTMLLVSTAPAIALHAITCHAITHRERYQTLGYREFIGKLAIFIVAFEIWSIGDDLTEIFYPLYPAESVNLWLGSVVAFSPLLVAWAFYRICVWYIRRGRWEPRRTLGAST